MKWHIGYIPQRTENRCSNKTWHSTVYSSIIHRSWKVTTTQMSISRWVDEQNVVCFYHGIPFSHKKQWRADTYCNVHKPWKHHAKCKKPDTKGHILHHSIYRCGQSRVTVVHIFKKTCRLCLFILYTYSFTHYIIYIIYTFCVLHTDNCKPASAHPCTWNVRNRQIHRDRR